MNEEVEFQMAEVQVMPLAVPFVAQVQRERLRQDKKWGPQDHDLDEWCNVLAEEFGSFAKTVNNYRMSGSGDLSRVIEELVHTSAVAQVIYEQLILPELASREVAAKASKVRMEVHRYKRID